MNSMKRQKGPGMQQSTESQRVGHNLAAERQQQFCTSLE